MILGSKQKNNPQQWILTVWLFLSAGGSLILPGAFIEAAATTIYSYIDEQGTPVMTDNFNTIPEKYRAKVKTTEQVATTSQRTSTADTIHDGVSKFGRQLRGMVSGAAPNISGLSPSQSEILTYAGLAAIVLLVVMNVIKGPFIRLLALGCLIMLGLGTPVLMYVTNDGPMDVMKNKASQVEKKHQDRVQQIP
jgi:hypothetical protein